MWRENLGVETFGEKSISNVVSTDEKLNNINKKRELDRHARRKGLRAKTGRLHE